MARRVRIKRGSDTRAHKIVEAYHSDRLRRNHLGSWKVGVFVYTRNGRIAITLSRTGGSPGGSLAGIRYNSPGGPRSRRLGQWRVSLVKRSEVRYTNPLLPAESHELTLLFSNIGVPFRALSEDRDEKMLDTCTRHFTSPTKLPRSTMPCPCEFTISTKITLKRSSEAGPHLHIGSLCQEHIIAVLRANLASNKNRPFFQ